MKMLAGDSGGRLYHEGIEQSDWCPHIADQGGKPSLLTVRRIGVVANRKLARGTGRFRTF